MADDKQPDWWIYQGKKKPHTHIDNNLPEAPPWRQFTRASQTQRGESYEPSEEEIELVNAALYLRRPLLITGKPGTGKTSLAYAVANELSLGNVLRWSITTHSTLKDGLYSYDAISRLHDASLREKSDENTPPEQLGKYLRLGPLGTAFAEDKRPRLLLIDEIDKSDIDLPNNLLHIFEEGEFEIPELMRLEQDAHEIPKHGGGTVTIQRGRVECKQFPLVLMTSNGEREFPPAFLRRCLQLEMKLPDEDKLTKIVQAHFKLDQAQQKQHEKTIEDLIQLFLKRRNQEKGDLATDQLLNAVYLSLNVDDEKGEKLYRDRAKLMDAVWKALSGV